MSYIPKFNIVPTEVLTLATTVLRKLWYTTASQQENKRAHGLVSKCDLTWRCQLEECESWDACCHFITYGGAELCVMDLPEGVWFKDVWEHAAVHRMCVTAPGDTSPNSALRRVCDYIMYMDLQRQPRT